MYDDPLTYAKLSVQCSVSHIIDILSASYCRTLLLLAVMMLLMHES